MKTPGEISQRAIFAACEHHQRLHVSGETVCAMIQLHFRERYSLRFVANRFDLSVDTTFRILKAAREKLQRNGLWDDYMGNI